MCGPCYKRQWNEETNYYKRHDQGRKEIRRTYREQYYRDNREKILTKGQKWREENPDYHREYDRKRREENPEEYKEYYWANWEKEKERGCRYREANREKERERTRRYREENREKCNAATRRWREENPEKEKERGRKWRRENPEKLVVKEALRRARKESFPDTLTLEEMRKLLKVGQDVYPGKKLELDHFVPLGRKENKICGTTRANCHYIPAEINRWKHDKLPEEFLVQLPLLI